MSHRVLLGLLVLTTALFAQRRVDPKNIYHRIIVVVPYTGTGVSAADPKRPLYAPTPTAAVSPAGAEPAPSGAVTAPAAPVIIAYMHVTSDDGKFALVEYVARDMAAFQTILNDKSLKVFIKGKDSKDSIEKELKKYKKDFSLDTFGVVMP